MLHIICAMQIMDNHKNNFDYEFFRKKLQRYFMYFTVTAHVKIGPYTLMCWICLLSG